MAAGAGCPCGPAGFRACQPSVGRARAGGSAAGIDRGTGRATSVWRALEARYHLRAQALSACRLGAYVRVTRYAPRAERLAPDFCLPLAGESRGPERVMSGVIVLMYHRVGSARN